MQTNPHVTNPTQIKPQLEIIHPKIDRNTFLGGSDCAAALGSSRWKSPLTLWTEKTGLIPAEDISDRMQVRVGTKLEDDVSELFEEETGKKLFRVNQTIFHPKYPFIGANLDRRVVGEDAIFEAKTTSVWKSKEWDGEEMPIEYILQSYHYLAVTGTARCYLAVLIGNTDFKWKVIERDEKLQNEILRKEAEFWNNYVVPKVMPKIITRLDSDTLLKLYPQGQVDKEIVLGDEANQLCETLQALKADNRNVENLIEETENKLKFLMGDATKATTGINEIRWANGVHSSLNSKRLKSEKPELYNEYLKQTLTRRLTTKKITKGEVN